MPPIRDVSTELVPTEAGDARLTWHHRDRAPHGVLLLGHGAGGGIEAPDLQAIATGVDAVAVVLVEQPWRVAGKRLAPAPKTLDAGWLPVVAHVRAQVGDSVPLFVGGRSAGARVACRTGAPTGAAGVVALAFPLHPPGKPERSRADELLQTALPTLVVQGARDPFGTPPEFPPLPRRTHRLVGLDAGNHAFAVRKTEPDAVPDVVRAVADWLQRQIR
ncbi:alpha/beta hydrolase family protein [Streptacidiphilus neutrinimicus]|uniref:alpha/beta hydrolase family protein n=1 Tax=Streptacidiphilus neutrinimicus TaxID=105420 RepID=UPI0005A9835E|nr:alpha/beta family hydrolase [Streptacidiphilus neutrinimicus]